MTFERAKDPVALFWSRVDKRGPKECWPWTAAKSGTYGRMKIDGFPHMAHRLAYIFAKGRLRDNGDYHGTVVRHKCDNPICCNPAHLVRGDQRKNVADMVKRGRGKLLYQAESVPKAGSK